MFKTVLFVLALSISAMIGRTAASLAAGAPPANASGTFNILFIGNSHVFVNDVPSRVGKLLRRIKGRPLIRAITQGGARLTSFTHRQDVAAALSARDWNVVVLQEATASFLSPHGRRGFHQALNWFTHRIPAHTRIILYQTWPWRADSRYFAGTSSNAARLWKVMQNAYGIAARRPRITVAPVGRCWMRSGMRARLYASDGNHASLAGSNLAATVIALTISGGLRTPKPPGSCHHRY